MYAKTNIMQIIVTDKHLEEAIKYSNGPDIACKCLIAQALTDAGFKYVAVASSNIFVSKKSDERATEKATIDGDVDWFINAFDRHAYALIRERLPFQFNLHTYPW